MSQFWKGQKDLRASHCYAGEERLPRHSGTFRRATETAAPGLRVFRVVTDAQVSENGRPCPHGVPELPVSVRVSRRV